MPLLFLRELSFFTFFVPKTFFLFTLTAPRMGKPRKETKRQSTAGPSLEDHMLSLKQLKAELDQEEETESTGMQLRNGTVVTPRKQARRVKTKPEPEDADVKSEDSVASTPKEEETVYMELRNRRVMKTPVSKSRRTRGRGTRTEDTITEEETQASVAEAEDAIQHILAAEAPVQTSPETHEKTKKKGTKKDKSASQQPQPKPHVVASHKPQKHPVVRCTVGTLFVLCAVLALAAGALGFCAAKGVPVVLHNAFNFDAVLPERHAATLRSFLRNAEALYGTLDPRTQVLGASAVFFLAAGLCGLCWAVRSLVRAAEEASKVDPVQALQRLLACRRRLLEHRAAVCCCATKVTDVCSH